MGFSLSEDRFAGTANVLKIWWLLLRVWKSLIVEVSSLLCSEDAAKTTVRGEED